MCFEIQTYGFAIMTLLHLLITFGKSKLKSVFEWQPCVMCPRSGILSWGFRRYEWHRKDRGAAPRCKMYLEYKKVGNGITHLFKGKLFDKKEAVGRRSSNV